MTAEFLAFSMAAGNDLSTPRPEYGFPGLKPGDRWCLCAPRWKEALDAGAAAPVVLEATHEETLAITPLGVLKDYAVDSVRRVAPLQLVDGAAARASWSRGRSSARNGGDVQQIVGARPRRRRGPVRRR